MRKASVVMKRPVETRASFRLYSFLRDERPQMKLSCPSAVLPLLLGYFTFVTTAANGQTQGVITLSSQPSEVVCGFFNNLPGVRTVYALHTLNPGATASRFRIEQGGGMTMTYLSESHPFPATVGDVVSGVSICYGGACLIGNQVLLSVTYMAYGTSSHCSQLHVAAHPDAETVEAMDCGENSVRTFVEDLYNLVDCGCPDARVIAGASQTFDCMPVPVSAKTWGGIKALYQ